MLGFTYWLAGNYKQKMKLQFAEYPLFISNFTFFLIVCRSSFRTLGLYLKYFLETIFISYK